MKKYEVTISSIAGRANVEVVASTKREAVTLASELLANGDVEFDWCEVDTIYEVDNFWTN